MTQTVSHARNSRVHKALMMSCASAAIAAAVLMPQRAHAQAFVGTPTTQSGAVSYSRGTPGSETVTIGSNTATINWSPTNQQQGGGPIDFLPAGNTATFTSAQGVTDYTVLNRILPDSGQAIALNGHVISTLQGTNATGGHVWFYAPGGIVVGATAVFDVGGLLLTTNDVTNFGTSANGFNATFSGPSGSTSKIEIDPGAQINALQQNSYVAMVAPRIEQGGKVRVNGSAAYAAGDQVSLTMNQGLFDIQVDVGTDDSNGIVHTGETSGPANAAATDNHKIYMVAVPKNQALTMLLGGTVGFDDATSASVKNGAILLSSGWGVADSNGSGHYYPSSAGADAGIDIGPGNYTSDLTAQGQGVIEAVADTGDITVNGDLFFNSWSGASPLSTSLLASNEHTLRVTGNVTLLSSLSNVSSSASISADSGGLVSIGGSAGVFATGPGTSGGDVSLTADGGSVSIAGLANLSATGSGGAQISSDGAAADGYGGSVGVFALDSGSVTTGAMSLNALGSGQTNTGTGAAGSGYGGSVLIDAEYGGAIIMNGNLTATAAGVGGNGAGQAGSGQGGTTNLLINGGSLTVNGNALLLASGSGGSGQIAGNGYGGSATAEITGGEAYSQGGSITATGTFGMQATGTGGPGSDNAGGTGGQGGHGYGGSAYFYVTPNLTDGATVNLALGDTTLRTDGYGGAGGNGMTGGAGGSGFAGTYYNVESEAGAYYGSGGSNFEFYGGTGTVGNLGAWSNGVGGVGGTGSTGQGGAGGNAYGGLSSITVGGALTATSVGSHASAIGGQGGTGTTQGDGGQASAAEASVDVLAGGSLTGSVQNVANAFGGGGNTGGSAVGGDSSLSVEGKAAGSISLFAEGLGGDGANQGGSGDGGTATLSVTGGSVNFTGTSSLDVSSFGGSASNGTGGSAGLAGESFAFVQNFDGGTITGGDMTVTANATGGDGLIAGAGVGGNMLLLAQTLHTDSPASMTLGQLSMTANGFSGTGAPSEAASSGGSIGILAAGSTISANSLSMTANGTNSGGWDAIQLDTDSAGNPGTMQFGSVNAQANAGDTGGQIFFSSATGGTLDLGDATLQASGGFGGAISLLTGYCFECGGGDTAAETALSSAAGGIAANSLSMSTTGSISVTLSGGGDLAVSGTLNGTAGQMISLVDDGTGGAIRAHEIDLSAITIDDSADIIADIINFTTAGYMTLGDLSANQALSLTAGSDLTTGNLSAANSLTLSAGGDADLGNLSAQTVNVNAAANSSVGNVNAPGSATFSAGGLATFTGTVSSPTITVTSSDLDVTEGASLGVSGVTNLLTLNAISHGLPIVIGDDGSSGNEASGQYHLNEDGDIRATSVVINAQGAVSGFNPDVQVFDTNVEGSATQGGGITNVTLNTAGSVFVTGLVGFTDAGANDSLTINAGRAIEVNTDTGGIEIVDGTGALTGVLTLKADNIWAASGSILSQLESDVNFSGRNTALGVNSGTANPNGFVRAGTIHASVADSFLVQNTNTADLFGGVDTGNGGLSISSTGTTPAALIVYGRQTNSNGTVITNQAFLGSVNVSGNGGFTTDSSVNGCAIGSDCGQTQPTSPQFDMASILGPLNETNSPSDEDKKKKDKDNGDSDDGSNADPSLKLINTTPINTNRPIDDPVTSGGDVVVGGNAQPN